ncbi:AraC family transcriptional regulator [Paenibacillus oryzisoli]|uniref:HTH araC/xylS-type domain-containing protein n=1 Tax=Paenibacillus oryzisoli TaxID=1850517 RepID=A0A198A851_9BACL|nr:helix-turn-helix domain-containing protein [Paenibacillus oryzisoli]OAS17133.1 hypothetical protein A8708_02635 [Paenibacillus oryzisoli]
MRYEERQPDETLQRYIQCYWYLERDYSAAEEEETLWPDGCQELIFHYGADYSIGGQVLPRAFFIGALSRYQPLAADGPIRVFGVRLLPWGLRAFKEMDHRALIDKFLPLTDVFPEQGLVEIVPQLAEADVDEGIAMLAAYLTRHLQPETKHVAMINILSKLYRTPMEQDVPISVAESGYSQRHFERICSELVGMSPKRLNAVSRFNMARLQIFFNPMIDIASCMDQFGYHDYAHFSKEFKRCLGVTPTAYKKWLLGLGKVR